MFVSFLLARMNDKSLEAWNPEGSTKKNFPLKFLSIDALQSYFLPDHAVSEILTSIVRLSASII